MSNGILVFVEHRDAAINKTSFEAIAAAQGLGSELQQDVSAVLPGSDIGSLAEQIASYDLAQVINAHSPKLAEYTPDCYTDAMERVVRDTDPQFVIMPHTYLVRDYAPKLARRFGKSLISDCVRAKVVDGSVTFTRRIFQGKIDADVVSDGQAPIFATFQSGSYRGDQAAKGSGATITEMPVDVGQIRMTPEAPFQ